MPTEHTPPLSLSHLWDNMPQTWSLTEVLAGLEHARVIDFAGHAARLFATVPGLAALNGVEAFDLCLASYAALVSKVDDTEAVTE